MAAPEEVQVPAPPNSRVPALTVMAPLKVLAPLKLSMLAPVSFNKAPLPLRTPEKI